MYGLGPEGMGLKVGGGFKDCDGTALGARGMGSGVMMVSGVMVASASAVMVTATIASGVMAAAVMGSENETASG